MVTRYDQLILRGFSPGVFLDGMRLIAGPYSTPQIDFNRMDHIDVVKGPASVLYGNSAPGGLVNLSSIIGNGLWNRMSRLLPLTMVGQMILFETLFALLYGFLWDWRTPSGLEGAAILFVLASVLTCLAAHRPAKAMGEVAVATHQ